MELEVVATPETRAAPHAEICEDAPAAELIPWALERFADRRVVATTAFGMEGCALIDMLARTGRDVSVIYVDTQFFFPETYALRDRIAERYPNIHLEEFRAPLSPEEQAAEHGPELWKRDPDLCCRIRKVEPMRFAVQDVDVWITALRASQSATRANIRALEWDWQYMTLKFNPLARWSREQIWEYIQTNDVPYNPLHTQGYPTIGCTHCTKAVPGANVTDYTRAGRWNGTTKTECGLHGYGI